MASVQPHTTDATAHFPLALAAVQELTAPGDFADFPQALVPRTPESVSLLFDRVPIHARSLRIHELHFKVRDGEWTSPAPLTFGEEPMQGAASYADLSGGEFLYFVKASGLRDPGRYFRMKVESERTRPPELVSLSSPIAVLSYPRVQRLGDGRVVLAFRDFESRGNLAFSEDGLAFGPAKVVVEDSIAQFGIADFADQSLAMAYQVDREGGGKTSWLRFSVDGGDRWSAPVQVTRTFINVHDPYLFRREDGDLDVYYSVTPEGLAGGFLLFRRSVTAEGVLGPEQQLTLPEAGSVLMPQIHRLPGGNLLVVLARVLGASGAKSQLVALELDSDAPTARQRSSLLSVLDSDVPTLGWRAQTLTETDRERSVP